MLEKVIENWTSRLDYIRASRGSPMPEIIFKMSKECSSVRNERLLLDRIRHSLLRSQKSQESRQQRLKNDRIQHAVSRSLESGDSRQQRLEDDCIRLQLTTHKGKR
ncbi:hypothetical protein TNCV_5047391 [Trichonephila clavipes]|nr:hypothetical protein TNCV_5047391 [Trichonephila clavipes]